ncbi:hypothetical protein AB0E75_24740 [Streptomyces griseoviridis]|uniref:Uncharacterized protein n=2 Tax=Streptomyces TaxID=1883 RepID=A0A918GV34_STRGD|nr:MULTISPECIES: hypothetical protein [Streptomyces]GGS64107.1 hypothetical protein GCM10010238_61460 [Streptomyces niveoruber]GGU61727.1 hypothetical protein GCM10010259_60490 [Streptomyces daghestanicus]GHI30439.1 hypothetical protein Sdagh_21690 [Streptomyces daghestanicus]
MMYPPHSSAFASVRRHFDDPRISDAVLVIVPPDAHGAEPARLTAAETHQALYGPGSDPQFTAAVWREVIRTAQSDLSPHGTGKLLAIWLALPRLTGTVHRVCARLRADRSDVEAEMVLALLEKLADRDGASRLSGSGLMHAARARAWHLAREGLRELPSTQIERIAQDQALTASGGEADAPAEESLDVRVDRPDGPDGLCAPLRFRVRPEHLRRQGIFVDTGDGSQDRPAGHSPGKRRRPGRRAGTPPVRPAGRRA